MKKEDMMESITQRIIDLLEKVDSGDITSWIPVCGLAYNPYSKHTYSNLNQLILSCYLYQKDYSYNQWLTFKQIKLAGGSVLKGEKSAIVTYSNATFYDKHGKPIDREKALAMVKQTPSAETIKDIGVTSRRYLKTYNVFNLQQTKGVDENILESSLETLYETECHASIDQMLIDNGVRIAYVYGDSAHFNSTLDKIQMPLPQQFKSFEEFCSILFHELIHWTGHESRLNRKFGENNADEGYAHEELVAELGSAFMCAKLNITSSIRSSSAYIKSWLQALQNDKRYILKACGSAQRAMSYIMNTEKANV